MQLWLSMVYKFLVVCYPPLEQGYSMQLWLSMVYKFLVVCYPPLEQGYSMQLWLNMVYKFLVVCYPPLEQGYSMQLWLSMVYKFLVVFHKSRCVLHSFDGKWNLSPLSIGGIFMHVNPPTLSPTSYSAHHHTNNCDFPFKVGGGNQCTRTNWIINIF